MNLPSSPDQDAASQSSPLAAAGEFSSPRRRTGGGWPAQSLGWLGVGLGVAGLAAPGAVARLLGCADRRSTRRALRLIGTRELLTGLAIVSRRRPHWGLWSRVVGDAIDIGLLLRTVGLGRGSRTPLALGALGVVAAADVFTSVRTTLAARNEARDADAVEDPDAATGGEDLIPFRAALTIDRPRREVYAFWRQLENLPRFMPYLGSVQPVDDRRSHWKAVAGGKVVAEWDAEIFSDVPDLLIGWRSSSKAKDVAHTGRVRFMDAPGNRGTEVHLEMRVALPGGALVQKAAKVFRKIPEQVATHDLHRLKQILETGAITLSDASAAGAGPHPARPSAPNETKTRPNGTGARARGPAALVTSGSQP